MISKEYSFMTSMKTITIFLSLLVSQLHCLSQNTETIARQRIKFNSDWKFQLGDNPDYKDSNFDDSKWRALSLPHDWAIEGTIDRKNKSEASGAFLPGGIGWYRKQFKLPENTEAKHFFIQFDGIYMNAEVWVNNQFLGRHPYGYTGTEYDLTGLIKPGQINTIAVRVDNSLEPSARFYPGAGIYRNVWLVKTSKIYVDHWDTFITTPQVSSSVATVHIITKINNQNSSDRSIILHTILLDAVGKQVASSSEKLIIAGDKNIEDKKVVPFGQNFKILQPKLWSVDAPYLYKAVSQVIVNGNVADTSTDEGVGEFSSVC